MKQGIDRFILSDSQNKNSVFAKLNRTVFIIVCFIAGCGLQAWAAAPHGVHHDLTVQLVLAENKLIGSDTITLKKPAPGAINFYLAPAGRITNVRINGSTPSNTFQNGRLRIDLEPYGQSTDLKILIQYEATFDDDVPTNPVNTDNPGYGVTGIVSTKGTFLLAGAGWYPQMTGSGKETFLLTVKAPAGTIAVTAGKMRGVQTSGDQTVSIWEIKRATEGIALSAGNYVIEKRQVGPTQIATFLLPANRSLAPGYLDATERYLALYNKLFGPYPFAKFAVVENFFQTGYGFPSYTLLGGMVLRLPFIKHTSLGHEVAHCWWGNGVQVDYSQGNWSEGLTTYVADYLYKEQASESEARQYRLQMMRNYATLVTAQNDFALKRFKSRTNPVTKTIGYDKSAMVFHMLRQKVGNAIFWQALRDLYQAYLFKPAAWQDIQAVFETRSKLSLQHFFDQWVYRPGAPRLALKDIELDRSDAGWRVQGRLVQSPPYYDLSIPIRLDTASQPEKQSIAIKGAHSDFDFQTTQRPRQLTVDPDFNVFRKLYPSEIPPSINSLKGATSVLLIISQKVNTNDARPVAQMLTRSLGLKHHQILAEKELNKNLLKNGDLIWIGQPADNRWLVNLPRQLNILADGFRLNDQTYADNTDILFSVFQHPLASKKVAALIHPIADSSALRVARLVPHYGKYSYLAFQSGRNRVKGTWTITQSPLIHRWDASN